MSDVASSERCSLVYLSWRYAICLVEATALTGVDRVLPDGRVSIWENPLSSPGGEDTMAGLSRQVLPIQSELIGFEHVTMFDLLSTKGDLSSPEEMHPFPLPVGLVSSCNIA